MITHSRGLLTYLITISEPAPAEFNPPAGYCDEPFVRTYALSFTLYEELGKAGAEEFCRRKWESNLKTVIKNLKNTSAESVRHRVENDH